MKNESRFKKLLRLLSPVSIFPLLFWPYGMLNSAVIVKVFGCGCPTVTTDGAVTYPLFNANDFTACFWFIVAVGTVLLAFFQSKKVITDRLWLRILYITGIAALSFVFMFFFNRMMMWD